MHTSRPITVRGRFLGVAIAHGATTWRVMATDPVIEELDGAAFTSSAEAERVAGIVLTRNTTRAVRPMAPVLPFRGAQPVAADA